MDGKSLSLFLPDNHDNEHWGRRNDLLKARKLLKREDEENCLRQNSSHAQNNGCKSISFNQSGLPGQIHAKGEKMQQLIEVGFLYVNSLNILLINKILYVTISC